MHACTRASLQFCQCVRPVHAFMHSVSACPWDAHISMANSHPMTNLRTPKGTIDTHPPAMLRIQHVLRTCERHFRMHGAHRIDTPTFELTANLGSYGEESKLIYHLADQGGDQCSLRYDLTVPFARYVVQHRIARMRRYQIGRVYRRDQPAITRGRLREFYQCDFDIAGTYVPLVTDAEVIRVAVDILRDLAIGTPVVRVNHRGLLQCIMQCLGIAGTDSICSAIDKLGKVGEKGVRAELLSKGCTPQQADRLLQLIAITDIDTLHARLLAIAGEECAQDVRDACMQDMHRAVCDVRTLFTYLRVFECDDVVRFDCSLARGLAYYTGMIFEAEYAGHNVGSVVGGGRYDRLTGQFTTRPEQAVPCVGMSIGVHRLCTLLQYTPTSTRVYVMSSARVPIDERLHVLNELWQAGIPCETNMCARNDTGEQNEYVRKNGIGVVVWMDNELVKRRCVNVRVDGKEVTVDRDGMVEHIKGVVDWTV